MILFENNAAEVDVISPYYQRQSPEQTRRLLLFQNFQCCGGSEQFRIDATLCFDYLFPLPHCDWKSLFVMKSSDYIYNTSLFLYRYYCIPSCMKRFIIQ